MAELTYLVKLEYLSRQTTSERYILTKVSYQEKAHSRSKNWQFPKFYDLNFNTNIYHN